MLVFGVFVLFAALLAEQVAMACAVNLDISPRKWPVTSSNLRAHLLAKKTDLPRKQKRAPRDPLNGGLPAKHQIIEFLNSTQGKAGKREIARAFGISGGAKIALKRLLGEMAEEGTLSGNKKDLREKGKLPPVTTLEVTGRDADGDLLAKPLHWEEDDGKRPVVRLLPADGVIDGEIGIGDRVLAKLTKLQRDTSATEPAPRNYPNGSRRTQAQLALAHSPLPAPTARPIP